jgi:hypothetical protein
MELSTEPKSMFLSRSSRFVVGVDLGKYGPDRARWLEKKPE